MYMSGFGGWQHRKPTGVHDQLWARALVLSANGTVMATLALDLLGLGGTTAREIANGVHRATEGVIAVDAVLVCSTHTHSGPDLQGLWGYAPDDYREMVVKRSIEAILEAFRSQRQARLRLSATSVPAFNRRGWGETDEEVTVLDIWDALSKTRIGLVINFGAHPNTIHSHGVVEDSLQISSDFCHYVRTNVEAAIGNGAPVLFFNGIQGDVDALGGGHGFARPRDYGTRISNAVIASLRNQEEIAGAPSLVFRSRQYRQIVTNNDFLNAMRSGALPDYLMPPGVNSLTLTVAYFSIGTALQAVTSPGESLTQNGLPAKRAMAAKYHMFLGLVRGSLSGWWGAPSGRADEAPALTRACVVSASRGSWRGTDDGRDRLPRSRGRVGPGPPERRVRREHVHRPVRRRRHAGPADRADQGGQPAHLGPPRRLPHAGGPRGRRRARAPSARHGRVQYAPRRHSVTPMLHYCIGLVVSTVTSAG